MKSMTAVGLALVRAAPTATAAHGQPGYGGQTPQQQPTIPEPVQETAPSTQTATAASDNPNAIKTHTPKVSREAGKAIQALQAAANANDAAAFAAALPAAQAAAKTPDDRYVVAILQLKMAATAKDQAGIASAIESMLASGSVLEEEKYGLYINLARTYSALKQDARATQAYQQALQINPTSVDATAGLAEAKVAQGQVAEGLALLQKGIAAQAAAGGRAPEPWYKRAVAVAYKAKLPQAVDISREWVRAYPTKANWSDALAIYQNVAQLDETTNLDLLRLKRVTGTLSPGDYFTFGDIAVRKGFAGEAKAVLDEGFAANLVKRSDPSFSQLYALASQKTQGDRESLPATPAADATSRQIVNIGDAYFGYGDYAKAAEFYRAALTRAGADADLINLHLGMALARQGDKAGAKTALAAVGGAEAPVAKYWLLYVDTNA